MTQLNRDTFEFSNFGKIPNVPVVFYSHFHYRCRQNPVAIYHSSTPHYTSSYISVRLFVYFYTNVARLSDCLHWTQYSETLVLKKEEYKHFYTTTTKPHLRWLVMLGWIETRFMWITTNYFIGKTSLFSRHTRFNYKEFFSFLSLRSLGIILRVQKNAFVRR